MGRCLPSELRRETLFIELRLQDVESEIVFAGGASD